MKRALPYWFMLIDVGGYCVQHKFFLRKLMSGIDQDFKNQFVKNNKGPSHLIRSPLKHPIRTAFSA